MNKLSLQRRKVVLLCAAVASMSGGPVLLRGHLHLMIVWIAIMAAILVYALAQFVKLKGQAQ